MLSLIKSKFINEASSDEKDIIYLSKFAEILLQNCRKYGMIGMCLSTFISNVLGCWDFMIFCEQSNLIWKGDVRRCIWFLLTLINASDVVHVLLPAPVPFIPSRTVNP